MRNVIAAVVAGIIMLIWGFVSWTILPWHNTDVHAFADQASTMQVMLDNAPRSGIYTIPANQADYTQNEPAAFVNVLKNGYGAGMGEMMGVGLIGNILMAYLAILLLSKTAGLNYSQKVAFIGLIGLLIGVAASFPYWNWFGFPTGYSLVNIIDTVITWVLAGLVIGKLVPSNSSGSND